MPANDLSLVSGSQIHTGQVGTTYPDTLYNLTGNADLLLKTSSGTILDISTTIGTIPDEINVKELAAEDNSLLVPSKGGDTDYNPSQKLGEVANTDKAAVDPLTGTNYEPPTTITSNNPLEKSADSADLITGDSVQNEDATAPSKTRTGTTDNTNSTDKITETGSEVGITSATEKSLGETVASPDKSSNEITNLETKSSPEKPITWDSETTDSLTGISTTDSPDKSTDSAASKITSETTNSPDTNISNSVESSATTNTENAALSNGETNNEQTIAPLTETATISEIGAEVKEIVTSPSQLTNSVESTATPDLVTGEFVENPTEKSPSNTQITTLSNAEDSQEESLTLSSEETTILPEVKPLLTSEDKPEIRLEITQETVASNGTNSNDLTGSVADKKTEESSSNSASNTPILTTNSPDAHQSGLAEEETKIENHVIENSITNEPKETVAGDKLTTEKPVDTSSEISNTTNTEKNPAVNGGEEEKKAEGEAEVSSDETQKELNPTATQPELTASPDPFTSGKFKVDTTGKVGIDFLFDGGLYQGQLAIFSLKGMAIFIPGSEAFIKEATARALSKSVQGHVVISDLSEGARFSGKLGEENFNSGEYLGVKTFDMTPGDEFGVMIVPNGTVQEVFDNPAIGGNKRPLFSMATANPENGMQIGQIADVTGEGNTFSMEDLRVDGWTDKDYNDFVFQVRGAVGKAVLMDDVVAAGKDWRTSDLGKALVAYAKPYITPEPAEDLETSLSGLLDDLEDVTSPADSLGNGIPTGEKDSPTTGELIEKGSASSDDNSSSILPSEKLDSNPDSQALAGDKEDNITEFAATDVPLKDNSETELTSGKTEEISSNLAALPQGDQTADNLPQTAAVEVEKIDNSGVDSPESSVLPATKSLSHPAITADTKETAVIPASVVNGSVSSASQNIEVAVSPITIVVTPPTKETVTVNSQTQVFVSETLPSFPETEILLHPNTSVKADLISRLESVTETFRNQSVATTSGSNTVSAALIERLENITENLRSQDAPAVVIDNTVALVSRLESMVIKTSPKPVETVQFEFPKVAQPLVGIFNENGFSQDNPKIDYSRITLAKDRVEDDTNPLVSVGEGNNPDTVALAIIEQINKNAPLVVGRAPASSEEWAKSLIEYVDTAKVSGQPNAIVSLNLNFTEVKKDGSITHRYELTQAERDALAYAQKYNVLVVVPAGDDSETMSALGEISLEFNNIMTVGAAKRVNDSVAVSKAYDLANTSGSGYALDILADGSSGETFNTSVAANKVAGAASQVWAANPKLSYRQVVDIIQRTATDLNKPNLDFETGSGLLNIPAAVNLAKVTPAIDTDVPIRWLDVDKKNQPLIGIIDTGFNGKNPDIDYKRIILGRDRVDNDNDPLLGGEGSEHGTHVLGIIGATQGNGIGIDGINDDAPIWLGRAIGSGKWAESLREFVDAAKASGQPKAVVNLSFDLTQTNPDGTVTTRYELTPQERQAIEYARQNGVMIVVAAGNNGGTMSALGQASQEFDNIITVGSINYNGDRADYSSFGYGLDLVARGGTPDEPVPSTVGEGVNLKQMTSDEEPPEDEMSANARTTFEEVFGAFSDGKESENDEQELESLTPEERQVYDEATKEIDQLLKDYLGAASEKIALEYVDGYYGASVDALSNFVDAFDGDLADNLIKAQEILEEAGFKTDTPTETNLDFSIPLDLGIGEMAGTSVAAAKVTGAVSQVWAANPGLSYFQVKEILKQTAVDLNKPGWDLETGAGLVNIAAAVELAKRVQPQAYQPQPIQSPLIWSGEGKVTPGERAVAVSVPTFTGRLMNAGYVTQTGWLRIRSNPGTNFAEVGRKYPGDAIDFDAYEDNGGWVPDPFMPGGGSSRWYKIAGTN
ncbi:MAG TPA: S8 family serine peptidase, partial [Kamptonema sp.]|nr:S8 family serine peptidase [Kamptonema sp.]